MSSKKKNIICTKPFEWFEASEDGSLYPVFLCCRGWLPKPAGDLTHQTPLEIWHSDEAKEIIKSVVDGSFKYCKREFCPSLNSITGPVKYVDKAEQNYFTNKVSETDFLPKNLNCSYDKSCNLSCPSCRTNLIMAKGNQKTKIANLGNKLLESFGSFLETIYITGSGDPFASNHFLKILTGDIFKKNPKLQLILHTNAQLFTSEAWQKLKQSKDKIDTLEISIDGASKTTYEKNRRPGKWDILLQNMEFISSLKRAGKIIYFKVSFVVQRNYHEMVEFIKLGKKWGVDTVYFTPLNNWSTYSVIDYEAHAIHKKKHPEHSLFIKELKKIDLTDSQIELGYLKSLIDKKPTWFMMKINSMLKTIGL